MSTTHTIDIKCSAMAGRFMCVTNHTSPFPKSVSRKLVKVLVIILLLAAIPGAIFAQTSPPNLDFSYSYINVTRNNGGGTLETGDIIEVRALVSVKSGSTISNVYYIASILSGTEYVPGSIKIITNEGVLIDAYTDASNDDQAVYDPSVPGIRVNIGTASSGGKAQTGANFWTTSTGGTVNGGDVPMGGGGTMGIIAYKLKITADFGEIINPTGIFYYNYDIKTTVKVKNKWTTITTTYTDSHQFNYSGIKIIKNQGMCTNFSGTSFTAESSFGSGKTQNRGSGVSAAGYGFVSMGANSPGDNYYTVANNTSADGSTNNTVSYAGDAGGGSSSRVFGGYWDIIGDHTNAANSTAGNLPVPPGTNGGYMLVVNAAIPTGEAYRDLITNLCPNTYYEFSAWFRNICGKCGQNYKGVQTYLPGVKPNLAFAVNDIDYYSTGDIAYTKTWVKRGFIYKTGPAETSFTLSIKNNASGGGGNDWVLDDINLATCYPNLIMNPSDTATACADLPITVSDTVKSYFNNYGNYQWEISSNGNDWTPFGAPASKTPVLINGLYTYHVDYTYTPSAADSGIYFRLKVATTQANLTNINCSVDNSQKVFLKVFNGCSVLENSLLEFSGSVVSNQNVLNWTVDNVKGIKQFELERSSDGKHFETIETKGAANNSTGNRFTLTDKENNSSISYYRLKLVKMNNSPAGYSKTVMLYNRRTSFRVTAINPFQHLLKAEIALPAQGQVEMKLCDMYGKIISRKRLDLPSGSTEVRFEEAGNLPPGMYILSTRFNGNEVQQKLIKTL